MKVQCLIMLLALLAHWQIGNAQDDRYGFYFTNHRTRIQIPFQFRSNLIIVPVCLNERDVLNFIVDTGVSYTIITDAKVFQQRPWPMSRSIKLTGMGQGSTQLASIVAGNSLRLGKIRIDHLALVVLNEDALYLSEYAGMPIHGIIGYDLFANLVVTIDFQHQFLTLTQPDHYRYRPGKGERYPILIQDHKAYTDSISVSADGKTIPLRMLLDTGAGQALLLDRFTSSSTIPIPDRVIPVPLGRGLTGLLKGKLGRLPTVQFGRFTLRDVLVSYPDSSDFSLKLVNMPLRQGNIGCELLRRFRVTFHYEAGYMVLKPAKGVIKTPFEHDMSGLEFRATGSQLERYFISQILTNSPAERAGLQVGDELVIINSTPTDQLTLGTINEILQSGEGRSVSLIIRRQGQLHAHRLSLKRLI